MKTLFPKRGWIFGAASIAALLAACERDAAAPAAAAAAVAPPAAVTEVAMKNMEFSPATVEIAKGGTVEWKNEDLIPHTSTSPALWDSGALASGQTWRHTFGEAGKFPYGCTFHPTMKGTVIVK